MGKTVLIVDDSNTMRKIVSRALRQAGIDFDEILEAGELADLRRQRAAERAPAVGGRRGAGERYLGRLDRRLGRRSGRASGAIVGHGARATSSRTLLGDPECVNRHPRAGGPS